MTAVEREQPAEATDVADDLRPERGADVLLDELDGLLAGRDVDAGVRIGQWVGDIAPRHDPVSWVRSQVSGSVSSAGSSSSTCFASLSATGTGIG